MTVEDATLAYQSQYTATRAAILAQVLVAWRLYGGVTEDEEDAFLDAVLPFVAASREVIAALVAAFIQSALLEGGLQPRPFDLEPRDFTEEALRGVSDREVWRRPVATARTALSESKPFMDAMDLAEQRLEQIALTDVVMAQRAAIMQIVRQDDRIVGYRRVLTGESCMLCAVASTQRYTIENLKPIHVRCDCTVAPIFGQFDPGRVINDDLLGRLQQAANTPQYWKDHAVGVGEDGVIRRRRTVVGDDGVKRAELGEPLEVEVRTHGELGPVLTQARHDFTSEDELVA